MKPAFTIKQRPDSRWLLTKGDTSMGIFDTLEKAEKGIELIVEQKIYYYDQQGVIIE
jgi:hypothetical protein